MELLAIAFALYSIYLLQLQLFHFDPGKTKHAVLWMLILCGFGIGYMLHIQFVIWLNGFFLLYCFLFFYCDATLYDKLRYGLFSILAFFIDYLVMVWLLAAPIWIIALSMVAIQYGIFCIYSYMSPGLCCYYIVESACWFVIWRCNSQVQAFSCCYG